VILCGPMHPKRRELDPHGRCEKCVDVAHLHANPFVAGGPPSPPTVCIMHVRVPQRKILGSGVLCNRAGNRDRCCRHEVFCVQLCSACGSVRGQRKRGVAVVGGGGSCAISGDVPSGTEPDRTCEEYTPRRHLPFVGRKGQRSNWGGDEIDTKRHARAAMKRFMVALVMPILCNREDPM
jgi:hypothetical protein